MNALQEYFRTQLLSKGFTRGNLPQLLQLSNSNKCLRRFDAFQKGNFIDQDMLARIRACEALSGPEFEQALTLAVKTKADEEREQDLLVELKARKVFVPHVWVIHDRTIPSPIFVVGFLGVHRFKYLEIPSHILEIENITSRLQKVQEYFLFVLQDNPNAECMFGPFGRATGFLFRDEFDHVYEYSLKDMTYINERPFNWRTLPHATLKIKGREI